MPITAEVAGVGVIDDFYDEDFAAISVVENGGSGGAALLTAAESAFAQRSIDSTLVVCPAAWVSKMSLLEQSGYRTAKTWMLKKI